MDETEELKDLRAEVERLREHNEKLLKEKKKAASESSALQERCDKLEADIERRDQAPINSVFESLAGGDFAGYLRNEFDKSFTVGKDDNGNLQIQDAQGKPVEMDGEACSFTADNVRKLANDRQMTNLNTLILAPQNGGGGSHLARPAGTQTSKPKPEPEPEASGYGLR